MEPAQVRRNPNVLRLEQVLRVLAQSNRLELLALLRRPRTLDEMHLTPADPRPGENPDRSISRQGVQNHLDQLAEAGLLRVGTTDRKTRRAVKEYSLNHARLFGLVEELREITAYATEAPLEPFETVELAAREDRKWEEGPKLVLVRGVGEGRAFPLRHVELDEGRGWVVGRAPDAHVRLDYDPYVSAENSEILRTKDGYRLLDLRSATNGTFLNWKRLPVGGEAPLQSGDILGLGRSLLVFRSG